MEKPSEGPVNDYKFKYSNSYVHIYYMYDRIYHFRDLNFDFVAVEIVVAVVNFEYFDVVADHVAVVVAVRLTHEVAVAGD